jgi:hypothetical protein
MIAFAIVLFLAAAAGWIAVQGIPQAGRIFMRFAAVLYAALSLSVAGRLAPDSVSDIVLPLACALLAFAAFSLVRKTPPVVLTAAILIPVCLAGIAAAVLNTVMLAVVPQLLAAAVLFLIARLGGMKRTRLYLSLGAAALLGAASCRLSLGLSAEAGLMLFSAAGFVGIALSLEHFPKSGYRFSDKTRDKSKSQGKIAIH